MPPDRSDRLAALVRHLPFAVDDFDAARGAYARWRKTGADADRKTAQLWAYCYVVWYFTGKFAHERAAGPSDFDRVVERACRRIFRSMLEVRHADRFPQFVSVVCRNLLNTYRERRRDSVEVDDATAAVPPDALDAFDRPAVWDAIEQALEALPPSVREVARMRLLEHKTYDEIAEATGHPLATARTYYSKAIARLRDHPALREVYYGEPPPLPERSDDPEEPSEEEVSAEGSAEVRSADLTGLRARPPTP